MGFHTTCGLLTVDVAASAWRCPAPGPEPAHEASAHTTAPDSTARASALRRSRDPRTPIRQGRLHPAEPRARFVPRRPGDIQTVPERSGLRRVAAHVPAWLGWWVLSMLLWLLLTSTVNGSEAIAGFGSS